MNTPSTIPFTQENKATSHTNECHQGNTMASEQMNVIPSGCESLESSNRMEVDTEKEMNQHQSTMLHQEIANNMEGMESEDRLRELSERKEEELPYINEVEDQKRKFGHCVDTDNERYVPHRMDILRVEFANSNEAKDKQQILEHDRVTNNPQKDVNRTKRQGMGLDNYNGAEYMREMLEQSMECNDDQNNDNGTVNPAEELNFSNESEGIQQKLNRPMGSNNENDSNTTEESRMGLIHVNQAEKKQSLEQSVDVVEHQNEEYRKERLRELLTYNNEEEYKRDILTYTMDTNDVHDDNNKSEFKSVGEEDPEKKYGDSSDQIITLQDQLNTIENEKNAIIKKLEKILERKAKRISKLKQRISILEQDLYKKEEQLTIQLSNQQHIHDKNTVLEKEIEKVKSDILNIQVKLTKKIEDQEQLLRKKEEEYSKLQEENRKLHYSVQTHLDIFYAKQNEVSDLEKKMKEKENENSKLKIAIEKLELINKDLQTKISVVSLQEKALNNNILKLKKKEDDALHIKNTEGQKEAIQRQFEKELNEKSKYEVERRDASASMLKDNEEHRQTTLNLKEHINPLQSFQHANKEKHENYNSLLTAYKTLKSKLESKEKELANYKSLTMPLNPSSKSTERANETERSESDVAARQNKKSKKRKRIAKDSDVQIDDTEKNKKYPKQNIVVSFTGFTSEQGNSVEGYYKTDKEYYESIVQKLGGTCLDDSGNFDPDPSVTHIIAAPRKRTAKTIKACLSGIWIMRKEWLIDSEKAGRFLPEAGYGLRNIESPLKGKKIYMTKRFVLSNKRKRFEAFETLKKLLFRDGGAEETDNSNDADIVVFESKDEIKNLSNEKSIMFDWDGILNFILTRQITE
jgi:hypothetical protein